MGVTAFADTATGSRYDGAVNEHDVTGVSADVTRESPSAPRPPSSSSGWLSSSDAIDHGRFAPGAIIAARYRVVGRLGRGGMGEVYRADDLKLGQPVALKFLPDEVEHDPARLMQLHGEVRLARQVAHPNVCRVYDIEEGEGSVFLAMEFIDGEDLASLLRRIGRFPVDRAVVVARQIAAGLNAAHERGIVHRDLKPANVMIDGAGRVRLSDFGLAGASGQIIRAGTPAYMAPEQLAGGEVTARSDIFALGLVMYELFTGTRALEARSIAELVQKHDEGAILAPSHVVADLGPEVDHAVMRCLARDPARRPASALAAVAALPGGDPLAAALAAGETPSPEIVAAAQSAGSISARTALACALWVAASLLLLTTLYQRVLLVNRVPFERPPAVLADRAQQLLATLGFGNAGAIEASGIALAPPDYLLNVAESTTAPDRWQVLQHRWPTPMYFWYRTSPRSLVPIGGESRVGPGNPPLNFSGEVTVLTDADGRLLELHAGPPQVDADTTAAPAANWPLLFQAAGLPMEAFTETQPQWVPRVFADERRAWMGQHPASNVPVRIEAATYRGRPVHFILVAPWSRPTRMQAAPTTSFDVAVDALAGLIMPALIVAAALLARRNLQLARLDRRGANKAAAVMCLLLIAGRMLTATYVPNVALEVQRAFGVVGEALFATAVFWLAYLGLEPFVRRHWPDSLVAWSRITTGHWHDPGVGRDVLFGICAGLAMTIAFALHNLLPPLLGQPEPIPVVRSVVSLYGVRETLGTTLLQLGTGLQSAMIATVGVVLLFLLVGRQWIAALAAVVLYTPVVISGMFMPGTPLLDIAVGLIIISIFVGVIVRLGLLASVAALTTHFVLLSAPLTADVTSWRGGATVWVWLLIGGTAALSLRLATARRGE